MARRSRRETAVGPRLPEDEWLCGLYQRLSDEDRSDLEENSIENQRKICMDYLSRNQEIRLVSVYTDNGFTGTNYSRGGFRQMMEDIESGKINCVIVKDLSRLGREYIETSELVERVFPQKGVRFIAVNNQYDSMKDTPVNLAISIPVANIVNDYYAKDTSQKIRSAIQTKMSAGEFMASSGSIPYGYIRGQETYEVDEEVRGNVVRIYQLRAQGKPYVQIARIMNEEGIPSPGRLRYMRGMTMDGRFETAVWDRKTIRSMVHNEVYLGHRVHGKIKREKMGSPKRQTDPSAWQYIRNAHEPIISQELFDEVQKYNQEQADRRSEFKPRAKAADDSRQFLRGKIVCGDCGARMAGMKRIQREGSRRENSIYYQCSSYLNKIRKGNCSNHYIPEKTVISEIRKVLLLHTSVTVDDQKLGSILKEGCSSGAELRTIRRQAEKQKEKKSRLWQDYADGLLSKEEYVSAKKRTDRAIQELEEKEHDLEKEEAKRKDIRLAAEKWLEFADKAWMEDGTLPESLDFLIKEIRIYHDKQIEIVLNYRNEFLNVHGEDI